MNTIFLLVSLLVVSIFGATLCLWLGTRVVRTPRTFRRALLTVLLLGVVTPAAYLSALRYVPLLELPDWLSITTIAVAVLAVATLVVSLALRTSLARAGATLLAALGGSAAVVTCVLLFVHPYVLEGDYVRTESMAPTLHGRHQIGVCPHCGEPATVLFEPDPMMARQPRAGMCSVCQKAGLIQDISLAVEPPDRFVANKLIRPERWDLVLAGSHLAPTIKYVKRVIGLPGEEVLIKDGAVWINGARQELPEDIALLEYSPTFAEGPEVTGEPVRLGPDEYFLVGDFCRRSSDSRDWGPYPAEYVYGVVTLIYWPLPRWHVFR